MNVEHMILIFLDVNMQNGKWQKSQTECVMHFDFVLNASYVVMFLLLNCANIVILHCDGCVRITDHLPIHKVA